VGADSATGQAADDVGDDFDEVAVFEEEHRRILTMQALYRRRVAAGEVA
jgi:hypothetical protein